MKLILKKSQVITGTKINNVKYKKSVYNIVKQIEEATDTICTLILIIKVRSFSNSISDFLHLLPSSE
mgnify:CR=1 FL=1